MITRSGVRQRTGILVDLTVVALAAALLYGVLRIVRNWGAPIETQAEIHLSLWALPGYTFLSFLRGFLAYGISLFFSLSYGYLATHVRRAEKVMVPLLDILQSIPVLGFLPGTVLALMTLFPHRNAGLELASILMIFTSQVWNMTFSFYQSVRSIPAPLREVSSLYRFSWLQRFFCVELPASAVGLAWNSMMSMAGGWFFLMVCEAFTLGDRQFRLPGLGSYMSVAIAQRNLPAILSGAFAMILMIVVVDTFLWQPVIVWVQKFRLDETSSGHSERSVLLDWFRGSQLMHGAKKRWNRILAWRFDPTWGWLGRGASFPFKGDSAAKVWRGIEGLGLGALGLVGLWGFWHLAHLVSVLPTNEWVRVMKDTAFTLVRVFSAVGLGVAWALPVGIWIGRSDARRRWLQPLVQVAASFPAPMIYPLIFLLLRRFGVSLELGAVILMLLGTQWYILFNVIAGASSVPEDLREASEAYHFTPWQRWSRLWFPATFPFLVTGCLTAAGGAWNASIVAEYLSVGEKVQMATGLGSLISVAASQARYDLLTAGVLAMTLTVVLVNRFLWKPLYRIAERKFAY